MAIFWYTGLMKKVLKESFFNQPAKLVAKELLGKFLVRKIHGKEIAVMITETEAYDGPRDLASHARNGKTKRTEIMFGSAGNFYVYLVYGMHQMVNVVTGPKGYPAAVLIRGVLRHNGPGKVTKFLYIDRSLNGKMAGAATGFWFEDRGVLIPESKIKALPRVGVAYAGPVWSAKKLRFVLQ